MYESRRWAASATAVALGAACLTTLQTPASAVDATPVVGAFSYHSPRSPFGKYVGAVHQLARVPGGTVLYWSVGIPPDQPNASSVNLRQAVRTTGDFGDVVANSGLYTVRLIDTSAKHVFKPLVKGTQCLCTDVTKVPSQLQGKSLQVFYAVFPPLPETTKAVDIDINGDGVIVPRVPVSDGPALTPSVEDSTVPLGQGWPKVPPTADLQQALANTKFPAVWDLVTSTGQTDETAKVRRQGRTETVQLSADVLFAFDKAVLTPKAKERIAFAVAKVKKAGAKHVTVTGYTDSVGSESYNLDLSRRRAQSVAAALVPALPGISLTVAGRGKADPVGDNGTKQGQALNRRVEISFEDGQ